MIMLTYIFQGSTFWPLERQARLHHFVALLCVIVTLQQVLIHVITGPSKWRGEIIILKVDLI